MCHYTDVLGITQGLLGCAKKAARQEYLSRETFTHHPQHLVADVGLQAVEGQDHPTLLS
jgi:hypothetical protein